MRMSVLAIIPARSGSKSIPRKNIAPLAGKPLLAWTIETALAAHKVQRIILSTDDEEFAQIGRQWGAEIPFLRPAELAQDETPGIIPILHAVEWLEVQEDYRPEWVLCLQPTSPLRTAADIDAAIDLAQQKQADGIVSVSPSHQHPYWMKHIDDVGCLQDFTSLEQPVIRRQDLPPVYVLNGAIYLVRRDILVSRKSWYTDKTYAYVMPPERSLDIDTAWDFYLVDLILQDRMKNESY